VSQLNQFPPGLPEWFAALLGAWLIIGAGVYFSLGRFLVRGGKVNAREFAGPDLAVCCMFVLWFGVHIVKGFGGPEHEVTQNDIIQGATFYVAIVAGLGMFLQMRGINPFHQFGITRLNVFICAAIAVGLLIAADPLILLIEQITTKVLNGKAQPQNIVEYFMNASQASDQQAVSLLMVLAVVVAPVAEETLFRGYIYGVLKRYAGPFVAAILSATIFAAMHLNLGALPALFVLALCLTVAYEATGSLLVNIVMHGLFNLSMLLAMLEMARHGAAP